MARERQRIHGARSCAPRSASARNFAYFMKLLMQPIAMCTKPGDAVEEAQLAGSRTGRSAPAATARARSARALAARMHRFGLQGGVAVLLRHVAHRATRRTHAAGRPRGAHRPVGDDVLVHRVVGPARAPAIEKAQVPVGIAFAMRKPAAEKAVAARHRVGRGARVAAGRERGARCRGELRRQSLVGVEAQHPVVRAPAPTAKFFCAPKPGHACSITRAPRAARDFYGIIAAARIDDDDFVGERHRREAVRQLRGGIAGDDTKAKGERPGHAPNGRGAGGSARE